MTRKHYAGRNAYGRSFSYDQAWHVAEFDSKIARDAWVAECNYRDTPRLGHMTTDPISRDTARRIMGSRTMHGEAISRLECGLDTGDPDEVVGRWLIPSNEYYNPYYWG